MARGGKITREDLLSKEGIKAFEELGIAIKKDIELVKQLVGEAKKLQTAIRSSASFKEVSDNSRKAAENVDKLTDADKKLTKAAGRLATELSKEGKDLAIVRERTRRATAENRKYAKSVLEAQKSTNTFGNAIRSFGFKFNVLSDIVSSFVLRGLRLLGRGLKSIGNVLVGFEQSMADVRAITKATDLEFEQLSQSARRLGGSTKFTAIQVAQLEKEYAKLGFTTQEILNASKATLDLAAATGSDLARSAEVAGKTLRGFRLDARETTRVTDVMAESFTSSALDIENFAESMKFVAPVAKVANTSIEQTTALLAILADAGITGSMAGTSLRKIFGELVGEGGDLGEVLTELSKEQLTLADAQQLVGERARTALLVLTDNIEKLPELTQAFQDAGGAAEEMAEVQLETLKGRLTILKSSLQGFFQAANENTKLFARIRENIDLQSNAIQNLSDRLEKRATKALREAQDAAQGFLDTISEEDAEGQTELITQEIERQSKALQDREQIYLDYSETLEDLRGKEKRNVKAFLEEEEERIGVIKNTIELLKQQAEALLNIGEETDEEAAERRRQEEEAEAARIKRIKERFDLIREERVLQKAVSDTQEESSKIADDLVDKAIEGAVAEIDALLALEDEYDNLADAAIAAAEDEIDAMLETEEVFERIEDEKTKKLVEELKKRLGFLKEANEEERDLKIALANEAFQFADALIDRRLENENAATEKELTRVENANESKQASLESQLERGIISEEQYAVQRVELDKKFEAQRTAIEEKAAAESLKLRQRAARIDKAQALFNIAIDTAAGIIKYASNPVTAPLVPFITALGLAQAAVVAATPIPQFFKGTDSSPEGPAWVGEEGRELMIDPSGKVSLTPNKATLTDLKKGTQIVPNDITESLLAYTAIATAVQGDDKLIDAIFDLKKEIRRKPVASSTMTPAGILTAITSGRSTINKLNRYHK